jgi:hypothetical protein
MSRAAEATAERAAASNQHVRALAGRCHMRRRHESLEQPPRHSRACPAVAVSGMGLARPHPPAAEMEGGGEEGGAASGDGG